MTIHRTRYRIPRRTTGECVRQGTHSAQGAPREPRRNRLAPGKVEIAIDGLRVIPSEPELVGCDTSMGTEDLRRLAACEP